MLMFLSETEDNKQHVDMGETGFYLAQSETLSMWRSSLTGTWEISEPPAQAGRQWKAKAVIAV